MVEWALGRGSTRYIQYVFIVLFSISVWISCSFLLQFLFQLAYASMLSRALRGLTKGGFTLLSPRRVTTRKVGPKRCKHSSGRVGGSSRDFLLAGGPSLRGAKDRGVIYWSKGKLWWATSRDKVPLRKDFFGSHFSSVLFFLKAAFCPLFYLSQYIWT